MSDETIKSENNEVLDDMNYTKTDQPMDKMEDVINQDYDKKNQDYENKDAKLTVDETKVQPKDELNSNTEINNGFKDDNEAESGVAAEDDDSDFGSFDDASFTELEEPEEVKSMENVEDKMPGGYIRFNEEVLNDSTLFEKSLHETMNSIFTNINQNQDHNNDNYKNSLLKERSSEIYNELSQIPHLQPPNWIKLNVRHNLLIKLGVPINLDEIKEENLLQTPKVLRRKSINEEDIKWEGFDLPAFEELKISSDKKTDLLNKTTEILSAIENDNLNNSSHQFLESSTSDSLQEKLKQYNDNYNQLIELSSVWNKQLDDQKQNNEVYESVIQNLIGYSQKLKRDEILAHLKKIKLKSKSKKSFWK